LHGFWQEDPTMRNSWARGAAALICAGVLAACGGSDDANDDRRANAGDPAAPSQGAAAATVALSGCVEAAPGSAQYVLRNVRFEPRAAGDAHRTTTTAGAHGITEGAWVRLESSSQDLSGFLGQRVMLKGAVADDGRNTIGTAGTPGVETPTGDTSQAASAEHHSDKQKKEMGRIARESMANGTAASVRVAEINGTGDRCVPAAEAR
jgi:hypothetical protein